MNTERFDHANREVTVATKLRALPWFMGSCICNTFFADFTFFGGSVFILFLSELGLNSTRIGFVYSIIPFCCMISPLVAPLADKLGYKKTFLTFYTIRKFILGAIFFVPLVMTRFGPNAAIMLIASILVLFAICRAIAETAQYPWQQEYVPNFIRGRISSIIGIMTNCCNVLGFAVASYVIGHYAYLGLHRFSILFALGITIGLIGVWAMYFVPGGKAAAKSISAKTSIKYARDVCADKNFLMYLLCLPTMGLAMTIHFFIPVYMKTTIGIPPAQVMLMDIAGQLGGFLTAFFWGWTSDRYGSKPVMQMSCLIYIFYPLCWIFMPLRGPSAMFLTVPMFFISGMAISCWVTSSFRYLFNTAVPDDEKKTSYMSIYYGFSGLIGGLIPIFTGRLLDLFKGVTGKFLGISITYYTVPFIISIGMCFVSLILISKLQAGEEMSFRSFLGLFIRGNPIKALWTLLGYYQAKNEQKRTSQIRKLGESGSPFAGNELIHALTDPSPRIRSEAALAICHLPKSNDTITALLNVLKGPDSELHLNALRSLVDAREPQVVQVLQDTVAQDNHYGAWFKSAAIRALAKLKTETNPEAFITQFRMETDPILKLSYAVRLLQMNASAVDMEILQFCDTLCNSLDRGEICLSFAQKMGMETKFLKYWRQIRLQPGTTVAMNLMTIARKLQKHHLIFSEEFNHWVEGVNAFAAEDFDRGVLLLGNMIPPLIVRSKDIAMNELLADCHQKVTQHKKDRQEYFVLLICLLHQLCYEVHQKT